MKFNYLLAVFSVVFLSDLVFAIGENDSKGAFPYMAFIYYSDESVVDTTGNRFLRGAFLILKDWLVTSAVQISDNANDVGFPRKTLLARVGAINIDSKFTLNEDEDEQEREIIQIVRPYNHSATQWWRTDITLMQTLLPFNLTTTVNLAPSIHEIRNDKPCFIVAYVKISDNSSERHLMEWPVDLLPPSIANCGSHFFETMTCAMDTEVNKRDIKPDFCQGNSGGPLVCDNLVVGLQTYIDNNCKAPHLYQLLSPWKKFINCATNQKCDTLDCIDICAVSNKDAPLTLESAKAINGNETTTTHETPTVTSTVETTPETSEATVMTTTVAPPTLETQTTSKEVTEETHETTTPAEIVTISTMREIADNELEPEPVVQASAKPAKSSTQTPKRYLELSRKQAAKQTSPKPLVEEAVSITVEVASLAEEAAPLAVDPPQQQPWPKEKEDSIKKEHEEECDEVIRKTNVEAQQNPWTRTTKTRAHSAAERNMCLFQSMFCIIVLVSFF